MSMSIDVRSSDQVLAEPARVAEGGPTAAASAVVDVLFPLVDDEEWPPYPAEMLDAVLIAHDLAEVRGVPWFVTDVSRGDIVQVRHDGIGYVGGAIVCRGGHSTVHVLATTEDELAPIVTSLEALGATTASGLMPPMLTVDVPENRSLAAVLEVLGAAESMTCGYTVACEQHRPRAPRPRPDLAPAARAGHSPQRG
jgi:Domain of unknown function (DUF4265)